MRKYGRETGLEAIPFSLMRLATVEPVQAVELCRSMKISPPTIAYDYFIPRPDLFQCDRLPVGWRRFVGLMRLAASDGWHFYEGYLSPGVEVRYYRWRTLRSDMETP